MEKLLEVPKAEGPKYRPLNEIREQDSNILPTSLLL
jgi:hypothetical protein